MAGAPSTGDANRLLDAAEVAEMLHVPETWVRETTRAGHLPHVRLGRYVRYRHDDLVSWLETRSRGGGPTFRRHQPRIAPTSRFNA